MEEPAVIRKLEDVVINRIAAGEVIQRPSNALKEMIENCLDAKSTSIQVTVHGGGMKFLQIQDNGTGIRFSDLEIVCERFTTSKLRKFEDLSSIGTYGFRGEALASISHVAHLSIVTKTVDAKCAYKASYIDSKLQGPPKPCAGNQGTKIIVEDLFYNISTRRLALKSTSEEFTRISEIVGRYSIQNHNVGFSLKKQGETTTEISTPTGSTAQANIQIIYGSAIARELLDLSYEDTEFKFKLTGQITNPNYSAKQLEFILFINGRLVECSALKKMIEEVYAAYLPNHTNPFVFLSLDIPPRMVDVNVHPTKEMVQFLHEQAILEKVRHAVNERLVSCQSSRTFVTQAILPSNITITSKPASDTKVSEIIRTDKGEQKLDKFFSVSKIPASQAIITPNSTVQGRRCISLSSILELQSEIQNNGHLTLQELFKHHSFVGCLRNDKLSFVQHNTKLFMCDTQQLCEEFFYQLFLYDFGNFGAIRFTEPISLEKAAMVALLSEESSWEESHGPREELSKVISGFLTQKAPMLEDYFSIEIDEEGKLHTIPLLLDRYLPSMLGLPMLIIRLATEVDWDCEKQCFDTLSKELARFYATPHIESKKGADSQSNDASTVLDPSTPFLDKNEAVKKMLDLEDTNYKWLMENIIFSALRTAFIPPKHLADNGAVLQIANLHELYQVFERC